MMRVLILTAILLCGGLLPVSAAERPNVVILLADDLGWKDIGCYGGPVKTPTLDRLAAEANPRTSRLPPDSEPTRFGA